MASDNLTIKELVQNVNAGDVSAHPILSERVDALVANLVATPPSSSTKVGLLAESVSLGAKPGSIPPDQFLFSEPVFNAALLKSMSAQANNLQPIEVSARNAAVSDAAATESTSPSNHLVAFQSVFDQMLSSEPDAHHVVICHLAMADDGDAIHSLVQVGTSKGTFNPDYCGEWMSGVGEILDAMNVPVDATTDSLWDSLKRVASKISDVAKKVVNAVVAVLPSMDDITKLANALKEMAASTVARLIDTAKDFLALMRNAFSKGIDFIKNMLLSLLHAGWDIGKLLTKFKDLSVDLFRSFIDALVALGSDVARKVVDWITTAKDGVLAVAKEVYRNIQNAGRSFVDFLKLLVGTPFVEGLIKGVIQFAGQFCAGVGNVLDAAAKFVVNLVEKALAAHIHLVRHFANVMSANAVSASSAADASSVPAAKDGVSIVGAVVLVADIVIAALALMFAPSYLYFTLSILLLIFAPLLVELVVGIVLEKKAKPSENFDVSQLGKISVGNSTAKYVVFSDLHRGTAVDRQLGISFTSWNSNFYAETLLKYFDAGYILVENGDAEDFWNDAASLLRIAGEPAGGVALPVKQGLLQDIMSEHPAVYAAISKFVADKRFVKILGNHDMDLAGMSFQVGGVQVETWDAMKIPARSGAPSTSPVSGPTGSVSKIAKSIDLGTQIQTLVLHGHQADDANSPRCSGIGRFITSLGVFAGVVMKAVDAAGNVFGDIGAKQLQADIQKLVSKYMDFMGPTTQSAWVKDMQNKKLCANPPDPDAKIAYEVAEKPTVLLGLNCLTEEPVVEKVKNIPMHVVMGHTHKTKAFQNEESDNSKWSAFLNSGTGGMLEKVLTCVEIVGTSASVVYHAADDATQSTKDTVMAMGI